MPDLNSHGELDPFLRVDGGGGRHQSIEGFKIADRPPVIWYAEGALVHWRLLFTICRYF